MFKNVDAVSIHAPVKGATVIMSALACDNPRFNPRSREGSDQMARRLEEMGTEFQSTLP